MGHHRGTGKLRIIGGEWRSRRLAVADLPGLRPTTDRNRETLFNWLAPDINGRRCLDLFAGSGALGLEALSRGAASCVFVEHQRKAADQLRRHLETLGATDRGTVRNEDALDFVARSWPDPGPDLVFLDPPFDSDLLTRVLPPLLAQLAAGALLYLEHPPQNPPQALEGWHCRRHKRAGAVVYALFEQA